MKADIETWLSNLEDPPGQWILGMDVGDIRETSEGFKDLCFGEGATRLERQEAEELSIKVAAISPNVAFALCTAENRRWIFEDGHIDRGHTAETWVFVRTDNGWKLHSGQSAIFPIEG